MQLRLRRRGNGKKSACSQNTDFADDFGGKSSAQQ